MRQEENRIHQVLIILGLWPLGVRDQSGGETGNCCGLLSSIVAEDTT